MLTYRFNGRLNYYRSIVFNKTVFLSKKAKLQLDSVVKIAEQYPNCNISVKGFWNIKCEKPTKKLGSGKCCF